MPKNLDALIVAVMREGNDDALARDLATALLSRCIVRARGLIPYAEAADRVQEHLYDVLGHVHAMADGIEGMASRDTEAILQALKRGR